MIHLRCAIKQSWRCTTLYAHLLLAAGPQLPLSVSLDENLLRRLDLFETFDQIGSPVALARRRFHAALTKDK